MHMLWKIWQLVRPSLTPAAFNIKYGDLGSFICNEV